MQVKPVARLTDETLGLLAVLGFAPYFTITVSCAHCGFIRMNVPTFDQTPTEHPCPICSQVCPCGMLSSIGLTRRPLPAHHVLIAPVSETFRLLTLESFEEPAASQQIESRNCEECGSTFQPRHGSQRLCGDSCSSVRASRRARRRYANRVTAVAAVAP